jgi:hypothetical protein
VTSSSKSLIKVDFEVSVIMVVLFLYKIISLKKALKRTVNERQVIVDEQHAIDNWRSFMIDKSGIVILKDIGLQVLLLTFSPYWFTVKSIL